MVIAVACVRVVQMSIDEVVHVVAVRDGSMSAVCSMGVLRGVPSAVVSVGAIRGIADVYRKLVVVHVALMRMMKVSVMKEIDVILMLNGSVTAVQAVLVRMILVDEMFAGHKSSFAIE